MLKSSLSFRRGACVRIGKKAQGIATTLDKAPPTVAPVPHVQFGDVLGTRRFSLVLVSSGRLERLFAARKVTGRFRRVLVVNTVVELVSARRFFVALLPFPPIWHSQNNAMQSRQARQLGNASALFQTNCWNYWKRIYRFLLHITVSPHSRSSSP